ncbi:exosome complex component RRP4 homolog [Silene latifolia]|uniref:exosome complex component RRP4 homolog n=1 Tax=Silene latifolia TaxID=37657 RepID=UPI003D78174F
MKETQLNLNQTQKIRLQRALDTLHSVSSKSLSDASVTVADPIPVNLHDSSILKGHGTLDLDGELISTNCGIVERVDRLVYVRSTKSRYIPETGNVIVGRVVEVAQKVWKVDVNAYHEGSLMLASVTLLDGIQRRRNEVDELNMRNIFEENDVISVEVRNVQNNYTAQLQARSDKYGKLDRGQLIVVPCYLVKKRKQHFHQLDQYGVLIILGCNGYVWVGELIEAKDSMEVDISEQTHGGFTKSEEKEQHTTSLETRQNICRISNAVRVLAILGFNITVEVILEIFELSKSLNVEIHDMLGGEFCVLVAEKEAERRSKN